MISDSLNRPGQAERRRSLFRRWAGACVVGLAIVLLAPAPSSPQTPGARVLVTTVDGAITPVIADHLEDGVRLAQSRRYTAYLVRLDTPGGLETSMRKIIQRFLAAPVPVIVYVSPHGARAASAGALITLSAHVAAMAPGTAIGASTPVDLGGGDVDRKVVNDAAALAESVARLRDRDVTFAVETVTEGRSEPAAVAVEIGAVDLTATSVRDLLDQIDGRDVQVGSPLREVTLDTAGAVVDEHPLGALRSLQQRLADPNLAFLFMSLGTLALIYELASPGVGVGGVLGVILVLLALFSLSVLPVSTVGVLFLLLAAGLFVAELFAPGIGVAAAGGTVSLFLSGLFLFRDAPGLQVSLAVVTPVAVVVGAATVVAGRLVVRSRGVPSATTGTDRFIGRSVTVDRADGSRGQSWLEGAWWNVRSTGAPLVEGSDARIVAVDGLDLLVEPGPQNLENEPEGEP